MTDKPDRTGAVNYRWIKFGIDYLNEPDFMQLSDSSIGVYLKLYLLAGRADAGGLLCNTSKVFTTKDLAWLFHIPEDILAGNLAELTASGYLAMDDTGFRVTRFLDEQGPGDNQQREKWRIRQANKRARARGELEQDQDLEQDSEKRRREEEVEVDIESHGDVTVTSRGQKPAAATTIYSSVYQAVKAEFTNGQAVTPMDSKTIKELLSEYPQEEIIEAIRIAVLRGRRNLGYVKGILEKGVNSYVGKSYEPQWTEVTVDGERQYKQVD